MVGSADTRDGWTGVTPRKDERGVGAEDGLLGSAEGPEEGRGLETAPSESRSRGRSQRFYPTWRGFHPPGGPSVHVFKTNGLPAMAICPPGARHRCAAAGI